MKKKLFITGALGFIGIEVVRTLMKLSPDSELVLLTRRSVLDIPYDISSNLNTFVVSGDLLYPGDWSNYVEGSDCILHLAGSYNADDCMHASNVTSTENLVRLAEKYCVPHFIFLSSVGVMGSRNAGIVMEDSSCFPRNDYEISKFNAEQIVSKLNTRGRITTVLRPSIVYSDRKRPRILKFFDLQRKLKIRITCESKCYLNIIDIRDLSKAIHEVVEKRILGTFILSNTQDIANYQCKEANSSNSLEIKLNRAKTFKRLKKIETLLLNYLNIKIPLSGKFEVIFSETFYSSEKFNKAATQLKK